MESRAGSNREAAEGLLDLIYRRRSVRRYRPDRVPDEDLTLILEAGRWAPSGADTQPWQFIAASRTARGAVDVAEYASKRMIADLEREPERDSHNAIRVVQLAHLAAYLATLPEGRVTPRLRPLERVRPEFARLVRQWAESMAGLTRDDEHSRCPVLRRIHSDAFWLDTIVVRCPTEGVEYGSRPRPLG